MPLDGSEVMLKAVARLESKAIRETDDAYFISGIATTPRLDRTQDRVKPTGASFNKARLPKLFLYHDSRQPVGNLISATPSAKGIPFEARIPKVAEEGRVRDRILEAVHSIKYDLLSYVSIGFSPLKEKRNDDGGYDYEEWDWLELSIVGIPANPDAVITGFKSLQDAVTKQHVKQFDQLERGMSATPARAVVRLATAPDVSGTTGAAHPGGTNSPKGKAMTATEQIGALEARRAAHTARMHEIMSKTADEGRSTDENEAQEFDRLESELKTIDTDLKRWRGLESVQKGSATAITQEVGQDPVKASASRGGELSTIMMKDNLPKGMEFVRHVKVAALAKIQNKSAYQIAKRMYPDMHRLQNVFKAEEDLGESIDTIMKANATAVSTGGAGVGALAQYQLYQGDFIEYLRPRTIIGQFGNNGVPSLRPAPFMISVPRQTTGGAGYWVGEGKPKPVTSIATDRVTLPFHKVANIAVVTEEMLRFSTPSIEALVRDALAAAIIERMDRDFIDPDFAGSANVSPASITYGATNAGAASGTDNNAALTDFRTLFASFIANNQAQIGSLVLIMPQSTAFALSLARNELGQAVNPGLTLNGGTFNGIPVITSEYAGYGGGGSPGSGGLIVLLNANEIYLADDGQVSVDASREASLQMLDNPTNDVTTPTPTTMVSMYQTDSVALRAERFVSWLRRRATAVSYLTSAAYTGLPAA